MRQQTMTTAAAVGAKRQQTTTDLSNNEYSYISYSYSYIGLKWIHLDACRGCHANHPSSTVAFQSLDRSHHKQGNNNNNNIQFVETALFEIPKHGYLFRQAWSTTLQLQFTVDALQVTHLLQEIIAKEPS
jgi:hypothetical protein